MRNIPNLVTKYDNTDTNNYPDARYKNDTVAGDNTGSELEAKFPNDILQAVYSLLRSVVIEPDNTAEKPGNFLDRSTYPMVSQFVAALRKMRIRDSMINFRERDGIALASTRFVLANDEVFVIYTSGGSQKYSNDGVTWISFTPSPGAFSPNCFMYNPYDDQFVAMVDSINGDVAHMFTAGSYSAYTASTNSTSPSGSYGVDTGSRGITYVESLGMYLVCGESVASAGDGMIAYSTDPLTSWITDYPLFPNPISIPTVNILNAIAEFVAVGDSGTIVCCDAQNGYTWVAKTSGVTDDIIDVAYSPIYDRYVAITDATPGEIISSEDGSTWVARTNTIASLSADFRKVEWIESAGIFMITGTNGTYITSIDGITWQAGRFNYSASYGSMVGVAYNNNAGIGVIVDSSGYVYPSFRVCPCA